MDREKNLGDGIYNNVGDISKILVTKFLCYFKDTTWYTMV